MRSLLIKNARLIEKNSEIFTVKTAACMECQIISSAHICKVAVNGVVLVLRNCKMAQV